MPRRGHSSLRWALAQRKHSTPKIAPVRGSYFNPIRLGMSPLRGHIWDVPSHGSGQAPHPNCYLTPMGSLVPGTIDAL